MAPKFGNYLFRNLKSGSASPEKASNDPTGGVSIEDQEIVLQPADFTTEIGGALNWASQQSREIRVKLEQTDGLMDGRVTISAKMLRELYPGLVPEQLKEETAFPLSLRAVVLQLQNVMRSPNDASASAGAPDFDTPIAQVAREDEGFFKLEENASPSTVASNPSATSPTGDFGSMFPLIREKEQLRDNPPPVPPVQVVPPLPTQESRPQKKIPDSPPAKNEVEPFAVPGFPDVASRPARRSLQEPQRQGEAGSLDDGAKSGVNQDPFADLPKPKLPAPKPPVAATPSPIEETSKLPQTEKQPPIPQRRRGLELLQELFLTDDFLDAGQVAELLCRFPKVRAALIMLDDGTVLGGDLPQNYQANAASPAPALMRAVREFGTAISSTEVSAFTLLADLPISVFLEGRVCMIVVHEGRGLLPGMRERFTQVTKALDALYDPGDKRD